MNKENKEVKYRSSKKMIRVALDGITYQYHNKTENSMNKIVSKNIITLYKDLVFIDTNPTGTKITNF